MYLQSYKSVTTITVLYIISLKLNYFDYYCYFILFM